MAGAFLLAQGAAPIMRPHERHQIRQFCAGRALGRSRAGLHLLGGSPNVLVRRGAVMSSLYLWVKALHIVFVASWFAGLFYLPRIFVNLASVPADSHAERERLLLMARRLYRFTSFLMVPALVFGLWLGVEVWRS